MNGRTFAEIERKIASKKNMGVQLMDEEEERKTQRDMGPNG